MKLFFTLCTTGLFLVSCNAAQNISSLGTFTPDEASTAVVEIKEKPQVEDNTVITGDERPAEPSQTTPKEYIVEPEVIDDSNQYVDEDITITTLDHSALNAILKQYVSKQGVVDYAGIKANWTTLQKYIAYLGENIPTAAASKNEQLAYWMNAYNAMTIDLILRNYPLLSIKDIKKPWDQELWELGGKKYNLNKIEHQILRKMGDARIHFGINCASFSCPPLLNEAFMAAKVDSQLEQLSVQFINDPKRNTITEDSVEISKIFTWFGKDFKQDGSLIDFLNRYSKTQISQTAKVRFKEYDWSLND